MAAIKVVGGLEEQIRIEIDEKRLAELRIPITEVTQVLTRENLNQASGSLYDLDANYMVRMLNQFRSVDEIERIILRDSEGRQGRPGRGGRGLAGIQGPGGDCPHRRPGERGTGGLQGG